MWNHIRTNNILADEQTGCARGRGGCTDQLLLNQMVIRDARDARRSLAMCWLDFRKAFDSLSQEWLLEVIGLYQFHPNIVQVLASIMPMWRTRLRLNGELSCVINIRRGIFQGDTLSPLLFCIGLNCISSEIHRSGLGYRCGLHRNTLVSHLWYMDDVKLFTATGNQLASLMNIVESVGGDIGMRLSPTKCSQLICPHGTPAPDADPAVTLVQGARIESLTEDSTYAYLGLREFFGVEEELVKSSVSSEFARRLRLVAGSALNAHNLVRAVNSYVLPTISYGLGVVNWTQEEVQKFDRLVRRTLKDNKAHHPRSSCIRLYLPRDMGGRGFISVEQLRDRAYIRLARYVSGHRNIALIEALYMHHGRLPTSKSLLVQAEKLLSKYALPSLVMATPDAVKKAVNAQAKNSLVAMPLHGQYWSRSENALDVPLTFKFLKSAPITPAEEGFLFAIQDQVIATRNYRVSVMHEHDTRDVCRVCGMQRENLDHILSYCPVLAQSAYVVRHNGLVAIVHEAIMKRLGIGYQRPHKLVSVMESGQSRLLWEMPIRTDKVVRHNRPDLVLVEHEQVTIVDISVPLDYNITKKAEEKKGKYLALAAEMRRIWNKSVQIVPIIVGAMGGMSTDNSKAIQDLCGSAHYVPQLQRSAVLGSMSILRSVLGMSQ